MTPLYLEKIDYGLKSGAHLVQKMEIIKTLINLKIQQPMQ